MHKYLKLVLIWDLIRLNLNLNLNLIHPQPLDLLDLFHFFHRQHLDLQEQQLLPERAREPAAARRRHGWGRIGVGLISARRGRRCRHGTKCHLNELTATVRTMDRNRHLADKVDTTVEVGVLAGREAGTPRSEGAGVA